MIDQPSILHIDAEINRAEEGWQNLGYSQDFKVERFKKIKVQNKKENQKQKSTSRLVNIKQNLDLLRMP